jgi:hypothetical protein
MTNGLVSVRVNGSVVLKIIAGSDGMNAVAVADAIKKMTKVPGPNEAYDLAIRLGFGGEDNLVVMDAQNIVHKTGHHTLSPRYRRTFGVSTFNPRWSRGSAPYVVIVDM